jgi:hypothetical protein
MDMTEQASQQTGFELNTEGFRGLLAVERYGNRLAIFDRMIAQTHDHFWDPGDPRYIDFDTPFDQTTTPIMPCDMVPELNSAVADRLNEGQKIQFANESARWWMSGFLHGEQGAFSLAVSLCDVLTDPGTLEYAANQAREEARHVRALSGYIHKRWETPLPASTVFLDLLERMVTAPELYRKIIGMQVLLEGLAMGFMAALHRRSNDPVLVRLSQLVLSDEAFHHKAGRMWAERALVEMPEAEREQAEDWALECFQTLMFNVMNPSQRRSIYDQLGLEEEWVRAALRESYDKETRRRELNDPDSAFRIMLRTLVRSGIVTDRTRHLYAQWVNLEELENESGGGAEMMIAAQGLDLLKNINLTRPPRAGRGTPSS